MADALICLGGCDKTVPAALMPIPRHNGIGLMLYAGNTSSHPPTHPPTCSHLPGWVRQNRARCPNAHPPAQRHWPHALRR